jgi:Phasin protein
MQMDTKYESKVEKAPYVETTLVSGKENLNTYLQLVEGATEAMFSLQHEVLKFADMRLAANMKLVSDVTEAKDAGDFARILAEHVSNMYEHISNTAVGYSQRVQEILGGGSKDNPKSAPITVHEYAKQSTGSKRQNVDA